MSRLILIGALLLGLVLALAAPVAAQTELLVNGGFQTGAAAPWSYVGYGVFGGGGRCRTGGYCFNSDNPGVSSHLTQSGLALAGGYYHTVQVYSRSLWGPSNGAEVGYTVELLADGVSSVVHTCAQGLTEAWTLCTFDAAIPVSGSWSLRLASFSVNYDFDDVSLVQGQALPVPTATLPPPTATLPPPTATLAPPTATPPFAPGPAQMDCNGAVYDLVVDTDYETGDYDGWDVAEESQDLFINVGASGAAGGSAFGLFAVAAEAPPATVGYASVAFPVVLPPWSYCVQYAGHGDGYNASILQLQNEGAALAIGGFTASSMVANTFVFTSTVEYSSVLLRFAVARSNADPVFDSFRLGSLVLPPEPTATAVPEPTATAVPEPTATATAASEPTATAAPGPVVLAFPPFGPDDTGARGEAFVRALVFVFSMFFVHMLYGIFLGFGLRDISQQTEDVIVLGFFALFQIVLLFFPERADLQAAVFSLWFFLFIVRSLLRNLISALA